MVWNMYMTCVDIGFVGYLFNVVYLLMKWYHCHCDSYMVNARLMGVSFLYDAARLYAHWMGHFTVQYIGSICKMLCLILISI